MALRRAKISISELKELGAAFKSGKEAFDPRKVTPMLAEALQPLKEQALSNLASVEQSHILRHGGKHIADALILEPSKDLSKIAAYLRIPHRIAPQAAWLELGHWIVGHKPKKLATGKFTPQRPWFRPAVVAKSEAVRRGIREGLQSLLKDAFGFGDPGDADS